MEVLQDIELQLLLVVVAAGDVVGVGDCKKESLAVVVGDNCLVTILKHI